MEQDTDTEYERALDYFADKACQTSSPEERERVRVDRRRRFDAIYQDEPARLVSHFHKHDKEVIRYLTAPILCTALFFATLWGANPNSGPLLGVVATILGLMIVLHFKGEAEDIRKEVSDAMEQDILAKDAKRPGRQNLPSPSVFRN